MLITTDDQTVESLRVMPKLRSLLAERGTTFSNSFSTYPLCCPARASILIGQHAHNHAVLGNSPPNGGYAKLDHSNTVATWLEDAGSRRSCSASTSTALQTHHEVPAGWTEKGSVDI